MRVLVVGAGATGTVFGAALARGGARVGWYVRPHHRERLANGIELHRQGFLSIRDEHETGFTIATTPGEVAAGHPEGPWDQVWFTTPSDALREPWLEAFLPATGKATLVVLQPDPEDIAWIRDHGGADRTIVQGLIQFSAWQSPLPREPAERTGITYLLPPGPSALFDADRPESATIAATLTRGGLPAGVRHDLPAHAARMSAMMIPLIAGLELADWKLSRYAGHEVLRLAVAASQEAVAAESARYSVTTPWSFRLLLGRLSVATMLHVLPWVPGFNAEAFLAYHFRKVDRQTRQMLATYRRHAQEHGLAHGALERLIATLPPPGH
ncbi:MAG: ketopantoate reductase family protein [Pseudomonadota bacterium]